MKSALSTVAGLGGATFRFLTALGALATRQLTQFAPRRPDRWVFGSRSDAYVDNPMFLYEFVFEHRSDVRGCWITGDSELVAHLRAHGRTAQHRWSPAGMWASLRAGVSVVGADATDTNFTLTAGALQLNLYHGLPLKRIEFDIKVGPAARVYHPTSLLDRVRSRVLYAPKHTKTDLLVAPSSWSEEVFRRSFAGHLDDVLRACPPRVTALLGAEEPPAPLNVRQPLADELADVGSAVLLYVPTWRRTGLDVVRALGDRGALERALEASDTVLVVKAHLHDATHIPPSARVRLADDRGDVMALLAVADGLITDYSSVVFDFALLDRPVVFAPYDLDHYRATETGTFNLSFEDLTEGLRVDTADALHDTIATRRWREWRLDPELLTTVWGDDPTAQGNKKIVDTALERAGCR